MAPKKYKQKQKQMPTKHKPIKSAKHNSNKSTWIAIGVIAIIVIVFGTVAASGIMGNHGSANPTPSPAPTIIPSSADPYANSTHVLLHTSKGDITVALRNDMPITTGNFLNLVQHGTYNDTIFHRIIAGFMIQGGDPTGTGYGDSSIPTIKDEFTTTNHNDNGTIAMANTGAANSGSSQFFINVANNGNNAIDQQGTKFDTKYPSFGKVISGMDVVMAISKVATNTSDKPLQDVTLLGASVIP
jgi:peptidylprolyl isomerase